MDKFNNVFEEAEIERSGASQAVGGIGYWILHFVMGTFALYSGVHGINASLRYAGNSDFARIAQVIGIVTIEIVLIGIYLAFLNGKITGAAQSIAAGITFGLGTALSILGIIADSQVNSGMDLSPIIGAYLHWGLMVAPAPMAIGAMLIHFLDPQVLRFRKMDQQKRALEEYAFSARMAIERARAEEELTKRGIQLVSRKSVLKELESITESSDFRDAIRRTAVDRAPALFSEAGILMEKVTIPGVTVEPEESSGKGEARPKGSGSEASFLA